MSKGKLPIKYGKGSLDGMIHRNQLCIVWMVFFFSNDVATWKIHHSNNVIHNGTFKRLNRIDGQPINNMIVLGEGKTNKEEMTQVTSYMENKKVQKNENEEESEREWEKEKHKKVQILDWKHMFVLWNKRKWPHAIVQCFTKQNEKIRKMPIN